MCTGSGNCRRPMLCRGIDQEDLAALPFPPFHSILWCSARLGSTRPRFFLEETGYILAKPLISFRELAPGHGYFSNRNKHSWKTYCYEERDCQTIAYPSPINWRMVRLLLPALCLEREKVAWKDISFVTKSDLSCPYMQE